MKGHACFTYCMLPLFPQHGRKRIVLLLNVDTEQVIRGKVLAALETAIRMGLVVVRLVVRIRPERQRLSVRGEETPHDDG